jgi:hypothetical protein
MQDSPLDNHDVLRIVRRYSELLEKTRDSAKTNGPTHPETRRFQRLANGWARDLRTDYDLDVDDLTDDYASLAKGN